MDTPPIKKEKENLDELLGNLPTSDLPTYDKDVDSDDLPKQILATQHEKLVEEVKRYRSDSSARKGLSIWAQIVVSLWLIAVIIILLVSNLSDTVLVALLCTSTLNVLGLMYIVLRGYFNHK